MHKTLITILCIFIIGSSYSQPGYFGKKNGFSVKFDLSPSFGRSAVLRKKETQINSRLRFFYSGYQLNYTRILGKYFQFNTGYGLNVARTVGSLYTKYKDDGTYYVNDPRVLFHRANIDFNVFYSGSIAPIGNFMGISFNFSSIQIGEKTNFESRGTIGTELENSNFLVKKYQTSPLNGSDPIKQRYSVFDLHFKIGNSYPINKKLTLSYCVRVPVFTSAFRFWNSEFNAGENFIAELNYGYDNFGHHSTEWVSRTTLRKYNRYGLELTLTRYF
jgi:hypothetical protein